MDERARMLLLGTAGCAGLFGLILVLSYGFPAARELDAKALEGFLGFQRPAVDAFTSKFVHLGDPPVVGVLCALLAAVALLRGRPRVAAAVVLLIGATSVSSQALKALLAYPRFDEQTALAGVAPAAFPSGHATAAMALAIAGVLAVPARLRPLAALVGAGVALAVGVSVVARGSHFASDVAGGFLLAAAWGLTIAAGLRLASLRWPQRTVRGRLALGVRRVTETVAGAGLATLAGAGVLVVLAGGALALAEADLVEVVRGHTAALLVGAALLMLALGLLAGVVLGMRQRGPR